MQQKKGTVVLVLNGAPRHEGAWWSGGTDPLDLYKTTQYSDTLANE